jgi:hypothetical protein
MWQHRGLGPQALQARGGGGETPALRHLGMPQEGRREEEEERKVEDV